LGLRQYAHRLEGRLRMERAAGILVLWLCLVACTSQDRSSASTAPQELSVGYVSAGNLDELRRTLTTESLVYTRPNGEHEPGLAESWSISDDGLTSRYCMSRRARRFLGLASTS
jgi:ABC-type transport system substrate-binding protein